MMGGSKTGRVKSKDLLWMTEQLATTEDAGVPFFRSLGMLSRMKKGTPLGNHIENMQRMISEGSQISEAMAADKKVWPATSLALVAAGEQSGSLGAAFRKSGELIEAQVKIRAKLRTALTYPVAVTLIAITLIAVLLTFVVPRFEGIYESFGGDLPFVTTIVIALSNYALLFIGFVVALIVGIVWVLKRAARDRNLSYSVEKVKFKIPVLGKLMIMGAEARVASTISSLISAGVPLLDALDYAGDTAGSEHHRRNLKQVKEEVSQGSDFTTALRKGKLWPEQMLTLVEVGESTGSLEASMEVFARRAADEVTEATTSITSIIEPLMMMVLGSVIGLFLLALYMPLIDIGSQIR